MDVRHQPDGSLLLTYDSTRWTRWAIGATLLLLVSAAYDYFIGARGEDRVLGLLGAATTLGLIGIAMLEQSRFRFDPVTRLIEWDQRWAFRRRSGITPFNDVQDVSVEVPIGDRGVPSRRVVLHLANGLLLPVTVGYKPDVDGSISRAAETLRVTLGHRPPTVEGSVRTLVSQGRTIDAIKLVRDKEGISLTEAKRRVEQIMESQ
jgi:hypothetical protein